MKSKETALIPFLFCIVPPSGSSSRQQKGNMHSLPAWCLYIDAFVMRLQPTLVFVHSFIFASLGFLQAYEIYQISRDEQRHWCNHHRSVENLEVCHVDFVSLLLPDHTSLCTHDFVFVACQSLSEVKWRLQVKFCFINAVASCSLNFFSKWLYLKAL